MYIDPYGSNKDPKLPESEYFQKKNLKVVSKSEHDIQDLREAPKCWKVIQFWEAPNFWETPKFWEAPKFWKAPIFLFFLFQNALA